MMERKPCKEDFQCLISSEIKNIWITHFKVMFNLAFVLLNAIFKQIVLEKIKRLYQLYDCLVWNE